MGQNKGRQKSCGQLRRKIIKKYKLLHPKVYKAKRAGKARHAAGEPKQQNARSSLNRIAAVSRTILTERSKEKRKNQGTTLNRGKRKSARVDRERIGKCLSGAKKA